MEFRKNNISIILNKELNEPIDLFIKRGNFIINQNLSELLNNFSEIEKLSKIWINLRFKNCKYDSCIHYKIKKMEKKL